jgi:hypothetical protein
MAQVIIAKNQGITDLALTQLVATDGKIAASGQITLTTWNTPTEILEDEELSDYIDNDSVLLNIDGADYTKTQSQNFMNPSTGLKRTANDFASFTNKAVPASADVFLVEDSAASGVKKKLLLSGIVGANDLPAVQARRTTNVSTPSGSLSAVTFDTTDTENNTAIVEHDNTTTSKIVVNEAGLYLIGYSFLQTRAVGGSISVLTAGIYKDGGTTTPIAGTDIEEDTSAFYPYAATRQAVISLATGYYELKVKHMDPGGGGAIAIIDDAIFYAVRLRGVKGDTGGVAIKKDNSGLGTFTTLDFHDLEVTDEGGNEAKIEPIFGSRYQTAASLSESSHTGSFTYQEKLELSMAGDTPAGDYYITWYMEVVCSSAASRLKLRLQIDDSTTPAEIKPTRDDTYANSGWAIFSGHTIQTLTAAAHAIDLDYGLDGASDPTVYVRNARITVWRVT